MEVYDPFEGQGGLSFRILGVRRMPGVEMLGGGIIDRGTAVSELCSKREVAQSSRQSPSCSVVKQKTTFSCGSAATLALSPILAMG